MSTATEIIAQIQLEAEAQVASFPTHETIEESFAKKAPAIRLTSEQIPIGKFVRQGDVYLTRVSPNHPHGPQIKDHQLAAGETLGSRHIVDDTTKIYRGTTHVKQWLKLGPNDRVLIAPFIESYQEIHIKHPQHGDYFLPAGSYQCSIQMDAKTFGRVMD